MSTEYVLILGGARSGKSSAAQAMALQWGENVLFVATAEPLDREMRQRIEEHKKTRPAGWRTIEAPTSLGKAIRTGIGDARGVIVDCVTVLASNVLGRCAGQGSIEGVDATLAHESLTAEIDDLLDCIETTSASFVIVSNEVGLGLVPESRVGRLYRDLLGNANQRLAARADAVYLMVAGLAVDVKRLGTPIAGSPGLGGRATDPSRSVPRAGH